MKIKRNLAEKSFDAINSTAMLMLIVITVYPLLYVLFSSFSDAMKLMQHRGLLLWPLGIKLDAYKAVFEDKLIWSGYRNTIFLVVVGTSWNLLFTNLAAYFFTRKNVLLKNFIMALIVVTMFFSGGLIPFFLVVKGVGLMNSLWSLIIPSSVSATNIIILRTAFKNIPESLEEAAVLDGAKDLTLLFRIFIPLSIPTMAVITLWYGVGYWNSWFNASIFINKHELYPLQLVLRQILVENEMSNLLIQTNGDNKGQVAETIRHATVIIATVPILCIYPFLQKYFVKGVMIGALKE